MFWIGPVPAVNEKRRSKRFSVIPYLSLGVYHSYYQPSPYATVDYLIMKEKIIFFYT